jgi:hypothetical protein
MCKEDISEKRDVEVDRDCENREHVKILMTNLFSAVDFNLMVIISSSHLSQ